MRRVPDNFLLLLSLETISLGISKYYTDFVALFFQILQLVDKSVYDWTASLMWYQWFVFRSVFLRISCYSP